MKITATITKTQSNVSFATATNAEGATVALASAENILVIANYKNNPSATVEEAHQSDDAMAGEVIKSARLEGVSRIWVVVPDSYDGLDVRTIRFVEEEVPQSLKTQRIGCYSPVPPVTFVN